MKNNMIQPERKSEISPNEFIRDDFPVEHTRDNNTPSEKRVENKNREDFCEYYY